MGSGAKEEGCVSAKIDVLPYDVFALLLDWMLLLWIWLVILFVDPNFLKMELNRLDDCGYEEY